MTPLVEGDKDIYHRKLCWMINSSSCARLMIDAEIKIILPAVHWNDFFLERHIEFVRCRTVHWAGENLAKTSQNTILDFFTVSSPDTLAYKLLDICLHIKTSKTSFFQIFGWFLADFRDGGSQNWPKMPKNRPKIVEKSAKNSFCAKTRKIPWKNRQLPWYFHRPRCAPSRAI